MIASSDVSTCAHPKCESKFKRFGDGELFVFNISDPAAWGLHDHVRQKVFWLCEHCCVRYFVRFDRKHHSAQVLHRPARGKAA